MKTLVVGASGATGKKLVEQLLIRNELVKIVVRPNAIIPADWAEDNRVGILKANILDLRPDVLAEHLADCGAVASCLGHNLSLRGIFGPPRKLVSRAIQLVAAAIIKNAPAEPVRLVLMNTAGNRNPDRAEKVSSLQKMALGLLRLLVPPQADNEQAAEFLRLKIGREHPLLEWVVVRPDSLINAEVPTAYELHVSPTRSALFNPGKSSRINVAHFMARLLTDDDLWQKWRGQMPVIYNIEGSK